MLEDCSKAMSVVAWIVKFNVRVIEKIVGLVLVGKETGRCGGIVLAGNVSILLVGEITKDSGELDLS